jgi:hypothetical protein
VNQHQIRGARRLSLLCTSCVDQSCMFSRTTTAQERFGQFSPDGRWVAYMSNESGRSTRFRGSGWVAMQLSGGALARRSIAFKTRS